MSDATQVRVLVDVGEPDVDQYQFDYTNRTVARVNDSTVADLSAMLKARLDMGTRHPKLVGRQTDEFLGLTDSWDADPAGAAALCEDVGLRVSEWQFAAA